MSTKCPEIFAIFGKSLLRPDLLSFWGFQWYQPTTLGRLKGFHAKFQNLWHMIWDSFRIAENWSFLFKKENVLLGALCLKRIFFQFYIKPMAMPWFASLAIFLACPTPQSPHCISLLVETWPWYLIYYLMWTSMYVCKSDKFCVWSWYCSVLQWYCIHWNAMMQQWMWSRVAVVRPLSRPQCGYWLGMTRDQCLQFWHRCKKILHNIWRRP